MESFWAALAAGADAIYMGGQVHNARLGSENFSFDELQKAIENARIRGVKIYITVNTLIDRTEFPALIEYIEKLQQLRVDAIIVQDLGLLSVVRERFPDLRVHASTQMFVHNAEGLRLLQDFGVKRAVLSREMTLNEIGFLNQADSNVETEVFVHGALCYSYSGNCLFSSMVGGRSANRGRCAQPCRLAYRLLADGQDLTEGKGSHVLSMADLCAIERVGELKSAGVRALKIEGRMKRPEYVATVTACYRKAMDWLEKKREGFDNDRARRDMGKVFNRRFTSAYLDGSRRSLISAHRPNNRGFYTGRVVQQEDGGKTLIRLVEPVSAGDGAVVWTQGKSAAFELSKFKVNGEDRLAAESGELIEVHLRQRVQANDRVFKTHDRELIDRAQMMIAEGKAQKIGVRARLIYVEGEPLRIRLVDANGSQCETSSSNILVKAEKTILPPEIIADKMGKTGNTPFEMVEMRIDGQLDLFIPLSDLNDTRRRAFDALLGTYFPAADQEKEASLAIAVSGGKADGSAKQVRDHPGALISVAVVSPEQAHTAIEFGASRVYLSSHGLGGVRINDEDILAVRRDALDHGVDLFIALPWFAPEGSSDTMRRYADMGIRAFLAGNLGDIRTAFVAGYQLATDYNLNVFNPYALEMLTKRGVGTVCLSQELNAAQIRGFHDLSQAEAIVHGDLAVMVSRCCILKEDLPREQQHCRASCRQHSYSLLDQKGYCFPLEFDNRCNQYVYNSRSLCAVDDLPRLKHNMPAWLRMEAQRYAPGQIEGLLPLWQKFSELVMRRPEIPRSVIDEYRSQMQSFSTMRLTRGHWHRGVIQI